MFIQLVIISCIAILEANGQETCPTASGTQNECINLYRCSSLLNLLKRTNTSGIAEREALRKLSCGFEGSMPKVCCPMSEPTLSVIPDPPDVTNHPRLGLINHDICGPITDSRIFGGRKSDLLQFPWMALIGYNVSGLSSTQFGCGGSLITKRYVLTAAHCVSELGSKTKLSVVRVGEHDLSTEIDCDRDKGMESAYCVEKYQDIQIENVHVHSEYSKQEHQNDIALIRLDADANFGAARVRPVCLPVGNSANLTPKKLIVTGWGTTEKGIRSQVLLFAKLDLASNEECAAVYRNNHGVNVTYKQLCAGGTDSRDSCTGDSGGPLQSPTGLNNVPKYVQFGVVNFGSHECGVVGSAGVYAKVVYYMDWILDNISE